jgi:hypothetical protein
MQSASYVFTFLALFEAAKAGKVTHVSKSFRVGNSNLNLTADVTITTEENPPADNPSPFLSALEAFEELEAQVPVVETFKWNLGGAATGGYNVATLSIEITKL